MIKENKQMIAKAIDAIVNLATRSESPKPIEVGGRKGIYLPDGVIEWDMQKNPMPHTFSSLQSLVDYIHAEYESRMRGPAAVLVKDPVTVNYMGEAMTPYGVRPIYANVAAHLPNPYPFGDFLPVEKFMICLQSRFVRGAGDWDAVASACAGVKKQDGAEYKDDGVFQTVAVQSGLSLLSHKKVPNPVMLAPYRTFAEVEQPLSSFVLRVTDGQDGPKIGLFDADGGAWRIDAMKRIGDWIKGKVPDSIKVFA